MSRSKKISPLVILLALILVTMIQTQESYAMEIKYEPNEIIIRNNPTVCSIEPLDSDLTKNQIEKFGTQSRVSVSEWQQHLQNESARNEISNWKINYKQLKYDEIDSNAILGCDVFLEKKKTPPSLDFWGTLGLALPNYQMGKTVIEIYYLSPKLCQIGERVEGNFLYIIQEPCYGEMMVSSQLGSVIRHELGHAFGLGHYMSTDENLTLNWNNGRAPAPSIMVEFSYEHATDHKIMPIDIQKLRTIYGDNGFILNSEEKNNLTLVDPHFADQNFTNFENSVYGFTLNYPKKWFVDDSILNSDDNSRVLYISDEQGNLNKTMSVVISNNTISTSDDQTILQSFIDKEKKYCDNKSSDDGGVICENFVLLESKVQNGVNDKVYTIKYLWNDGINYHISHQNYIITNGKTWMIKGEGILAPFLLDREVLEYSINSFQLNRSDSLNYFQLDQEKKPHPNLVLQS